MQSFSSNVDLVRVRVIEEEDTLTDGNKVLAQMAVSFVLLAVR